MKIKIGLIFVLSASFAVEAQVAPIVNDGVNGIGGSPIAQCPIIINSYAAAKQKDPSSPVPKGYSQCLQLKAMSNLNKFEEITVVPAKESTKRSADGLIVCERSSSFTMDYGDCEKALVYYNSVIVADQALELQQKIRTDLKNSSLQKEAAKKAAEGDAQGAMFDAGIESNKQQKEMQIEKAGAYSLAVAALMAAYATIPGEKTIIKKCKEAAKNVPEQKEEYKENLCDETVKSYSNSILSNQDTKAALVSAVAKFVAKGAAAGIAMGQYKTKADAIAEAKKSYEEPSEDLMMEQCAFNPTDPACARSGQRVSGQSTFKGADFGVGDGSNNAFNMNPDSGETADIGAETNFDDLKSPIASINSPFVDAAKEAKGIMNPAAAASFQATGGAAGGGGAGGGGAGGGGGGASLGSDLQGVDKDANGEAQIKTGKVSGAYAQGSGGGYKGVGKGKEEAANPFASLFDAKSEGGGVEEDRSIASGDIDGAASGLFQKISKRYGQIQADKRIEANNLE